MTENAKAVITGFLQYAMIRSGHPKESPREILQVMSTIPKGDEGLCPEGEEASREIAEALANGTEKEYEQLVAGLLGYC